MRIKEGVRRWGVCNRSAILEEGRNPKQKTPDRMQFPSGTNWKFPYQCLKVKVVSQTAAAI